VKLQLAADWGKAVAAAVFFGMSGAVYAAAGIVAG
jgi:hypothetical protein